MLSKGEPVIVHASPIARMNPRNGTIVSVESQYGMKDARGVNIVWAFVTFPETGWATFLVLVAEDGQ